MTSTNQDAAPDVECVRCGFEAASADCKAEGCDTCERCGRQPNDCCCDGCRCGECASDAAADRAIMRGK